MRHRDDDQFAPERLADRARIATVMAAYARCADLNLPDEQAATFADDGRVSYHPDVWIVGRARIAVALRESLARFQRTSHHLGNLEIAFDSADRATAQSTVIAWHRRNDGSEWTLFGRYVDRWVRQDDEWLIAERVLRVAGATGRDESGLPSLGRAPGRDGASVHEVTSADVGFPINASDVTPAWLTEVLRDAGAIGADDAVTGVTASSLGAGAGFMGDVSRLRLDYAGDTAPIESVVLKSAAPDPAVRELVRGYRNYEREVAFFASGMGSALGDAVPRSFTASIDPPSNHFVLVLEDLSAAYRDGDQVSGATYEQARDCLDVQAALHARFWDAGSRAELATVPRVDGDFFVPTMTSAFAVGWAGILERFPELIPAPLLEIGDRFADQVAGLARRLARAPQTLVHSDFRLDNIMFAREGGPSPVKVLDWQGILVSAGVHDVAFLLSQNLADGVRESAERDLLAHYHRRLVEHGVTGYPLDDLWEDYRVAVLLEWVYPVIIGGSLPMETARSRALFAVMIERAGRAIVDLDALGLLPPRGQ